MPRDDFIRTANKAEAKAKIQGSTYLDQRCSKGKQLMKMSFNSRDNQTNKKALQAKEKANSQTKQGTEKPEKSEKTEKARKEKKMNRRERQK